MHQPIYSSYYGSVREKGQASLSKEVIEDRIILYEYYLMVRVLNKILEEEESKLAKKVGLTLPQYTVLIIAYYNEGLKVSEIARIGSWHISTVMSLLSGLLEREMIILKPVSRGRGFHVYLTDKGRELREETFLFELPRLKRFFGAVGVKGLSSNLKNLYRILDEVYGKENLAELKEHLNKSKRKFAFRSDID